MKLFVFVILSVLVISSYQQQQTFGDLQKIWQDHIDTRKEECVKETKVDENLVDRLMPYGEYVDDYKLKCFVTCISKNLKIVNDDFSTNNLKYLKVMAVQDDRILNNAKIIDNCFTIHYDDHCESVFELSKCVYKSLEKEFQKYE